MATLKTKVAKAILSRIKNAAAARLGLFPDFCVFGISEAKIETISLKGGLWILVIEARNRIGATSRITLFLDGKPAEWIPGPMDQQTLVVDQRPDEPTTIPEPICDNAPTNERKRAIDERYPPVDGNGETPDSCKGGI